MTIVNPVLHLCNAIAVVEPEPDVPVQPNKTHQNPLQQFDLTLIRRVGAQLGRFGEDGCFLGWLD